MNAPQIWLPGAGLVPAHIRSAQEAVEAYDPDLELGFDQSNDNWVAQWKRGPGGAPFPAISLGKELPNYEEIQRILYMGDVGRRGRKVVDEIVKRNEDRKASSRKEMQDKAGEVAEHLEYTFRRMGQTNYKKVFLPGKDFVIT